MKVIRKKQRIKIYKRALEIIENEEYVYDLRNDRALCFLLPAINLNVKNFREIQEYKNTVNLFPEFGKFISFNDSCWDHAEVKFYNIYTNNRDLWRRVVLKLILEELKANEEI